jgi:copper oxidase (laccase) domain-containing protein
VTTPATGSGIRERLAVVRENVALAAERSGRDADEVRVLVASKYYAPEQVGALASAGVDLGLCTGCRPDLFFSHRKQKPVTGRSLAAVVRAPR